MVYTAHRDLLIAQTVSITCKMGKHWDNISPFARNFIAKQHMFFVATAPSSGGRINMSPKGYNSFVILDDHTVAYLDLTGMGVETIAHVKENGRITFMFCSFDTSPCILRLWGHATVHERGTPEFNTLIKQAFPAAAAAAAGADAASSPNPASELPGEGSDGEGSCKSIKTHAGYGAGARSVIVAKIFEVATACGYGVPIMEFLKDRDTLLNWSAKEGPEKMAEYSKQNNAKSLDGLAGFGSAADAAAAAAPAGSVKRMLGGAAAAVSGLLKPEVAVGLAVGVVAGAVLNKWLNRA